MPYKISFYSNLTWALNQPMAKRNQHHVGKGPWSTNNQPTPHYPSLRGRFQFFPKNHVGIRLVHRAKDYNMINTGQYGSVPGKTAIEL
jgi:hypothetical protein